MIKKITLFNKHNKIQNIFDILNKHKEFAKFYYIVKSNEQLYPIDKYTFEYFQTVVKRISILQLDRGNSKSIHKKVIFKTISNKKCLLDLIANSKADKPLISNKIKKVRFKVNLRKNIYEDELLKLNKLWRNDLNKLLVRNYVAPDLLDFKNLTETYLDKKLPLKRIRKLEIIRKRLKMDERITPQKIKMISRDLSHSLRQKYKNHQLLIRKINNSTDIAIIKKYLTEYLVSPSSISVILNNIERCVNKINQINSDDSGAFSYKTTPIELTYLDKNEDFFRAVRFTDAMRNCITTDRKHGLIKKYLHGTERNSFPIKIGKYLINSQYFNPINAVSTLYRDPFTFIIDVKDIQYECIIGFVFGRLAVNPANGKMLIMVSDTYLKVYNKEIIEKVLEFIETGIAKAVNAEGIIYANTTGNKLQTNGFSKKWVDVLPLHGVTNNLWGMHAKFMYDDFGLRLNSRKRIAVYYKKIQQERLVHSLVNDDIDETFAHKPAFDTHIFQTKKISTLSIFLISCVALYAIDLYHPFKNVSQLYLFEFFTFSLAIVFYQRVAKKSNYTWYKTLFYGYFRMILLYAYAVCIIGYIFLLIK